MFCPFCNNSDTIVKDSRISSDGKSVRRRRMCENCNARFSTFEKPHVREIYVIKRSGVKKLFDRQKIHDSIATAMRKRNNSDVIIEQIVNKICAVIQNSKNDEIPTRQIGDMILNELAQIDEVAYIRFASVYKDFLTAKDFTRFINFSQKIKN